MNYLRTSKYVVVDVETTKTNTYQKRLLGVAVSVAVDTDVKSHYFTDYSELWPALQGKEIICHNASFDLRIIEENGCPPVEVFWDTMIMAHLCNENYFSYSLDFLAKKLLREDKADMKLLEKAYGGWDNIPPVIMGPYACRDAFLTMKLFIRLRAELQNQNLEKLWLHARQYIRTLQSVVSVGVPIDWQQLVAMSAEATSEMAELERSLGFVPTRPSELAAELFVKRGLSIPPDLTSLKTGKPILDDAALRYYSLEYPEVKPLVDQILRYRALKKANSTWYEGWLKFRSTDDCLHPGLKQHGTATGRLSCAEPNLQQLPRDSSRVKKLIRAHEGYTLVELDYSQIELRLGSYYAKAMFDDPTMFDLYKQGADVHTNTTELIGAFDKIADRHEARQVGKTGNFLWIYGGSAGRLRSMLWNQYDISASSQDCEEWTERFHKVYPGYRRAYYHYQSKMRALGSVKMWNGRVRRIRPEHAHMTWNSVVQGGCGQLLMVAMNKIHKAGLPSKMCNTVHDSIWVMVPSDRVDEQVAEISALMREVPERLFDLPFDVDAKLW